MAQHLHKFFESLLFMNHLNVEEQCENSASMIGQTLHQQIEITRNTKCVAIIWCHVHRDRSNVSYLSEMAQRRHSKVAQLSESIHAQRFWICWCWRFSSMKIVCMVEKKRILRRPTLFIQRLVLWCSGEEKDFFWQRSTGGAAWKLFSLVDVMSHSLPFSSPRRDDDHSSDIEWISMFSLNKSFYRPLETANLCQIDPDRTESLILFRISKSLNDPMRNSFIELVESTVQQEVIRIFEEITIRSVMIWHLHPDRFPLIWRHFLVFPRLCRRINRKLIQYREITNDSFRCLFIEIPSNHLYSTVITMN